MSKLKVIQNGTFADGEAVYQIGYELEDGSFEVINANVMRKVVADAKLSEMGVSKSVEMERARDENGHYIADDVSTPDVNEAFVAKKKAPAKKKKA
tara:strand:+ start:216 stop:503 length:288 start_codon:yes stop_codon:yes gene_type:complete